MEPNRFLKIDRTALYRTIRKEYNITPSRLVENIQLEMAVNLLKTNLDILYSVAVESGFTDDRALIRIFRKRLQQTPTAIRKIIRNSENPEQKAEEFIFQIWTANPSEGS